MSKSAQQRPLGLKRAAARIAAGVATISRWLNVLGTAALGGLIGITVVDVLGRSIFNKGILGAFEITEYLLSVIVFCTVAWCAVTQGHIKVDIITTRLPERMRAVVGLLTHLASFGLLVIIAWRSIIETSEIRHLGKVSTMLNIPAYPFYCIMVLGFIVLCCQVLIETIGYVREVFRK